MLTTTNSTKRPIATNNKHPHKHESSMLETSILVIKRMRNITSHAMNIPISRGFCGLILFGSPIIIYPIVNDSY